MLLPIQMRHTLCAGLLLLAGPVAAQIPPVVAPPPSSPSPAAATPLPDAAAPPVAPTAPPVAAPPADTVTPPPAAATPAPDSAPPSPSVAPPAVDPQVTTLFQQAIAAHKALKALSATVKVTNVADGKTATRLITLAYQKPGRAKVGVTDDAGPLARYYTTGKTVIVYVVKSKTYQVQPVPPGTDTIPVVLSQAGALLPRLLGFPDALNSLLAQPGVAASVRPATAGDNAAVTTVVVTLPAPGGSSAVFTFNIGKVDHLLRQVTESANRGSADKPQTVTHTETATSLSPVPIFTATDFTFKPPLGVKKIAAPKAGQAAPMHDPRLVTGARPFPVAAKDLSGNPLSLAQYKGKVVLMDFWATWCGPCVGEMPNVIAAYNKYHAQGFDIVGVSLDESRPALTSFIAQNKMPWRQVFDGKQWSSAVPREYGVSAIPFGLLVGRDGKIAAVDVRGPALDAAIQQALAK